MRHATRAILTATAITAVVATGVAVALAATPSRPVPVAPARGDGTQARLGNVSCGQTLTESTILANDLANCAGDGLVVGADGITVDLNGHTIDGRTIPTGSGILISGFDRVVVENGTITGFDAGVSMVFGADQTRVQGLRISDSPLGNGIEASALRSVVTGNTVFGRAIGILMGGSTVTAASNTVKDNDTGILAGGSSPVVTGNTVLSNAGHGIQVIARAGSFARNVANANGENGIDVAGSTTTIGTRTVTGNSASFNSQLGIDASGDVSDGGANTATGNGSLHQCENVVCVEP